MNNSFQAVRKRGYLKRTYIREYQKKDINEKLLVERYLDGATSRELGIEFKISHLTVLNRVKKYVDIERQMLVKKSIKVLQ